MILKIEIPEKFIEHFGNDKFKDSLGRICYDIENAFKTGSGVSGRYEWELVEMLADAFAKSEDYDHANERMEQAGDKLEATVEQLQQRIKDHVESFLAENEKRINELESQLPKWISVKDMLPEDGACVLCRNGFGVQFVAIYANQLGFFNDGDDLWVTHWMPLPTQPTTEESEKED